jgi:hypothetical protein
MDAISLPQVQNIILHAIKDAPLTPIEAHELAEKILMLLRTQPVIDQKAFDVEQEIIDARAMVTDPHVPSTVREEITRLQQVERDYKKLLDK